MRILRAMMCMAIMPFGALAHEQQYCREFTRDIEIGGKKEQGYGIACRQFDGSWEIVANPNYESELLEGERYRRPRQKVYLPDYKFRVVLGDQYKPYRYKKRRHKHYRGRDYEYGGDWYRKRGKKKRWLRALKDERKHHAKHRRGNFFSILISENDRQYSYRD